MKTKHVFTSKTQIVAMISSGLICYGIYARTTGKPAFELSETEILAIGGIVCNVLIQLDRMLPKKGLHFFKSNV